MKKLFIVFALALTFAGCKTSKKLTADPFSCDVNYIGYAESHGADLIPGDVPIPSGITFKLWHMVAVDGRVFIGVKIEEKILWFIPLEYGKHVWECKPGDKEWEDPGSKLSKAYAWANDLDKYKSHGMWKVGDNCQFRRVSDGYIEGFHNDYKLWSYRSYLSETNKVENLKK